MSLLGRLIVIAFACLAATFAAGLAVTLAVLIPEVGDLPLGPFEQGTFGVLVAFGVLFVSAYALVPVLLVIACSEAFAIRAMLFYAIAGALLGIVLALGFDHWRFDAVRVSGFARRELEIMAAAGIVAGFVYWALAGRNAGRWWERSEPRS
jgi:hypothetical protein